MFVSRRDWDSLVERVKRLEDSHSQHDDPHSITVYDSLQFRTCSHTQSERVMLKHLVLRIIKHLGMGLKYRGGQPAGVDMVPLDPPPPAAEKQPEK